MDVATTELPRLVAPRPMRIHAPHFSRTHPIRFLSPPSDHFDRLRLTQADQRDGDDRPVALYSDPSSVLEKDASPRSASCSGLPSEAVEEFLAILRPTLFRPSSPRFRPRMQSGTVPLPTFYHEHPKHASRFDLFQPKSDLDGTVSVRDPNLRESSPASSDSPSENSTTEFDVEIPPARWSLASHHSSPISRLHTRNPFQRHPSYELTALPPGLSPLSPSPSAIPLPLPTPDELIELS